ncbi:VOC family protein [Erythrobacter sp. WG]|uniref:VOC family protein n=1 Tax=Erythrobacter sp. WG TaxID=2985510 RepID=UPI00226DFB9D|nr:VOC family protein [Erythrobacter sp. WG]MCX9148350.1 VOC family protein [Erythrobacter sp. WG]
MTYPLDHLTILSRDPEAAARFYAILLPHLGFVQKKPRIWANHRGLHIQFLKAKEGTGDYGRHAPGLNHFGFAAPTREAVEALAEALEREGIEARLQTFPPGITALFVPDPDGLRVEVSYYPPGVPPVD